MTLAFSVSAPLKCTPVEISLPRASRAPVRPTCPPRPLARPHPRPTCCSPPPPGTPQKEASAQVLRHVDSIGAARVGLDDILAPYLSVLEAAPPATPCAADARVLGIWRNAHTTRPRSASRVQRAFVAAEGLTPRIEQLMLGRHGSLAQMPPRAVVTRVDLREALGAVLNVRADVTGMEGRVIHVAFREAWFRFDRLPTWLGGAKLPVAMRVPYPVPFRLLGDKAKGWQEVTYLDDTLRITRGNRGSCFVLVRVEERDALPITDDVSGALRPETAK